MDLRWKQSPVQQQATSTSPKADATLGRRGKQSFRFVQGQSAQRRKKPRLPRGRTSAGLFTKFRLDLEEGLAREGKFPNCTSGTLARHDNTAHGGEKGGVPRGREPRKGLLKSEGTNTVTEYPISGFIDDDQTLSGRPSPSSTPGSVEQPHTEFLATGFDTQVAEISSLKLHPYVQQSARSYISHPTNNNTTLAVLSPSLNGGVMYRSLAHKYSAMFAMCRSSSKYETMTY